MFRSAKQKRASCVVFGIYLLLLAWLVLFKFATSPSQIPTMRRSVNLIPFHYDQETSTHLKEVLYNILVFVPLGVFIQIFKRNWKFPQKCLTVFSVSLLFEAVQFLFAIGASDITDLIGNTSGGMIGIFFCAAMEHIAPKNYIRIINALGSFIEIMAIALLVLLLAANR